MNTHETQSCRFLVVTALMLLAVPPVLIGFIEQGKTEAIVSPSLLGESVENLPQPMLQEVVTTAESQPIYLYKKKQLNRVSKTIVTNGRPDPLLAQLSQLTKEKNWNAVVGRCDEVLKTEVHDQQIWDFLLYALEKKGGAESLHRIEAIALGHPHMAYAHAAYARSLAQARRTSFALAVWHKTVELEPDNIDYRLGLAVLNDQLGYVDAAIKAYKNLPVPRALKVQKRLDYLMALKRQKE